MRTADGAAQISQKSLSSGGTQSVPFQLLHFPLPPDQTASPLGILSNRT
jgi:hypothetical protein